MARLTLATGLPGSGVSKWAEQAAEERNAQLVTGGGEWDELRQNAERWLAQGQNVVVQAYLRSPKIRAAFLQMARTLNADTEIVFVNASLEKVLERVATFGRLPEEQVRKMHRHLQIPTYAEDADRIEIRQDAEVNEEARDVFRKRERELIDNPRSFMQQLLEQNVLTQWIPEYQGTIGLDQHSPYHTYNVFDHILRASSFVAGTNAKIVWTLLLHDIGKGFPGIKQFLGTIVEPYGSYKKKDRVAIENGEQIRDGKDSGSFFLVDGKKIPKDCIKTDLVGHFYDHENVGAQLALFILTRLGYSLEFAHEVAALIQFHMTMPRNMDTIQPDILKKWYAKVGKYAPELMMVRMADDRAK